LKVLFHASIVTDSATVEDVYESNS